MAKTVDPKQYQIYVDRQGANYIDYQKISERANKLLTDEVDRRDKIKQDLDDRANDLYDQIGTVELNSDSTYSDHVLDAAAQLKKSLMMDQSLLKAGKLSVNEFKQQMERAKSQMNEWGVVTKNFGTYKDEYDKRNELDETTGEVIAAPDELLVKESALGFGFAKDKQIYVDPVTKNTYFFKPNDDGSIPDFETQADKYLPISNARNLYSYTNDRKGYDVQFQVKNEKDLLGAVVESAPGYFSVGDRPGMYIMTDTQYTAADDAGLFDEFVDTIYAKTSGTDQGIANTAAVMGDFTLALSEEQFKQNCGGKRDGVDYCDLKYFIKVNPNDPKGMSYSFEGGKDFVTNAIRDNIKDQIRLQLGAKKEIDNVKFAPNKDIGAQGLGDKDKAVAGFFDDYKNMLTGDQDTFNASQKDLVRRANQKLEKNKSDKRITDVKRTDRELIIKFVDGDGGVTEEKISLFKDDNPETPRPDSQIYQEMDAFFRPEGYDSVSFSALEDQAGRAGFTYDVEGKDFRGTQVESERGFTKLPYEPLADKKVPSKDLKSFNSYSDDWKSRAERTSKGVKAGTYDEALKYFETTFRSDITSLLQDAGINLPLSGVRVYGTDLSGGGENEFRFYIKDPITGKEIKETIRYDKPSNDTNSVMKAYDSIIRQIISTYNETEGGKSLENDDDDKKNEKKNPAPTT